MPMHDLVRLASMIGNACCPHGEEYAIEWFIDTHFLNPWEPE